MSVPHYWRKWKILHKECGTPGNIINAYRSATGCIRFSLYCYMCATEFVYKSSFEDEVVWCNDQDRMDAREKGEIDLNELFSGEEKEN